MNQNEWEKIIIDCISDLHGYYPKLDGGDLLIIAGDLTARDTIPEYMYFAEWICKQKYRKKVLISGNHDTILENGYLYAQGYTFKTIDGEGLKFDYLCDSGTEFEGLKIWGSPWTLNFQGQNPKCKAFGLDTEEELKAKWDLIPDDVDILITHSPSYGILDKTVQGEHVGSKTLKDKVLKIRPKLHVFGHIHEDYGQFGMEAVAVAEYFSDKEKKWPISTIWVNASQVNERYNPVNEPIRVIL